MTGMMPLFVAAPRVILRVADTIIGYGIGLRLNVSLDIERVKIIGQYEPVAIEPMFLPPCSGTFRVVRLLSQSSRVANSAAAAANRDGIVSDTTNFGSSVATVSGSTLSEPAGGTVLGGGALARHLDPETILFSQTFDLDIYIKVPSIASTDFGTDNILTSNAPVLATATRSILEEHFLKVKDCRLSGASVDLTPGRLMEEPFAFEGLIAQTYTEGNPSQQLDTSWHEVLQ